MCIEQVRSLGCTAKHVISSPGIEESSMKASRVVVWFFLTSCTFAQTSSPQNSPAPGNSQEQTPPASTATTPAAKIDPSKEADIRQLMEVVGVNALMLQMMGNMEKNIRPLMANALPSGEYREKLIDLFFEKFHSKAAPQTLLEMIIPLYDKYLSDKEIKELVQFYQTPLGQKTIQVMPKLLAESQDVGRKWGEKLGRESMIEVLSEHPELAKAMDEAKKNSSPQ
jgi:hypothetical protein